MRRLSIHGWQTYGVNRYRHFCGARVLERDGKWSAVFADRSTHRGHASARAAVKFIQSKDPSFWTFKCGSVGCYAGACIEQGYLETKEKEPVFIIRIREGEKLAPHVDRIIRKYLFGTVMCDKCCYGMTTFQLLAKPYFGSLWHRQTRTAKGWLFLTCSCGHPLWLGNAMDIQRRLIKAEQSMRRYQLEKDAEGIYTPADIEKMLRDQNGTCLYCSSTFDSKNPHTIEHIEPLSLGGSHWPENLCLVCLRCNVTKSGSSLFQFALSLRPSKRRILLKNTAARFPLLAQAVSRHKDQQN